MTLTPSAEVTVTLARPKSPEEVFDPPGVARYENDAVRV
jgi:hypothetical protein